MRHLHASTAACSRGYIRCILRRRRAATIRARAGVVFTSSSAPPGYRAIMPIAYGEWPGSHDRQPETASGGGEELTWQGTGVDRAAGIDAPASSGPSSNFWFQLRRDHHTAGHSSDMLL